MDAGRCSKCGGLVYTGDELCAKCSGGTSTASEKIPPCSDSGKLQRSHKRSWRERRPPVWVVVLAALLTCGAVGGAVWAITRADSAADQAQQAYQDAVGNAGAVGNANTADDADAMLAKQTEKALEAATKENIYSLQIAVQTYAVDHKDLYPRPSSGDEFIKMLRPYLDTWPTNPYTDEPMGLGKGREATDKGPGDFGYVASEDGKDFMLVGFGRDHEVIIRVP